MSLEHNLNCLANDRKGGFIQRALGENRGEAGGKDLGDIAATTRTMDQILKDYGIAHDFEIYDGDHVNRVGQRLETKVLPFFSMHLKFQ